MPRTRSGRQSSGWPTRSIRSLNNAFNRMEVMSMFGPDSPPSSQRSEHDFGMQYSPPASPRNRSVGVQANMPSRDTRHRPPDREPYVTPVKTHKRRKPKK